MMDVLGRTIRMQNEPLDIGRAEMEYARLAVIDPDDGMVVMCCAHGISPLSCDRHNLRIKSDKYHVSSAG